MKTIIKFALSLFAPREVSELQALTAMARTISANIERTHNSRTK